MAGFTDVFVEAVRRDLAPVLEPQALLALQAAGPARLAPSLAPSPATSGLLNL